MTTGLDVEAYVRRLRGTPSGVVAYEIVLHHEPTLEALRPSDVMRLSRG